MKNADPTTDDGAAEIRGWVDKLSAVFVGDVAAYRGVTPEKVLSDFGRGGVKVGQDAVDAGMADSLGDFESVVTRLSRGERASAPRPTKRPPAGGAGSKPAKGATMSLNPFAVLANLWKSDPAAVQAALDESADPADPIAAISAKLNAIAGKADDATGPSAEQVRLEAEAKARRDFDAQLSAFYSEQAGAHFAGLVKAGKLTPAETPHLSALYVAFAMEDRANPLVAKGADGKEAKVSRLAFLTDATAGNAKARWTEEVAESSEAVRTGNALPTVVESDDSRAKAARLAKMLAATPEGKAALVKAGK